MASRFILLLTKFKNPVARGSLIYTAASIFNAAIPFFLLPVLTAYLTPAEYGVVSTFMVSNSILVLIVGLEQHGYISVSYFRVGKEDLKKIVSSIITLNCLLSLVAFLSFIILSGSLESALEIDFRWILFSLLVAWCQTINQINLTLWQLEAKPAVYGFFQISNSLINYVISIVLVVGFDYNEDGRIYGIVTAAILFSITSLWIMKSRGLLSFRFDWPTVRRSLVFSLPLLPHALAGWVNSGLDRILINNTIGISETGLFSISYQIGMLVSMVGSSFNRAFAPYIFKNLSTDENKIEIKERLVKYTYTYFVAIIGFAAALYVASPIILDILVDDQFHGAEQFLLWLILGFLFDSLYYGVVNYLFYARKTFVISIITLTSCTIHFFISYLLLPRYGAIAAAFATAVSYFLSFSLTFIASARVYPMPWFATLSRLTKTR